MTADRRYKESVKLLESIDRELRSEFDRIKPTSAHSAIKGAEYQESVRDFLEKYLGGRLEFHTNARLVDSELQAFEKMSTKENDFDVVGIFRNAIPKVLIKGKQITTIPFDAVALVVEVKQTLDASSLRDGLKKLQTLNYMKPSKDRFLSIVSRFEYTFDERPLRWLFAFERSLKSETMDKVLREFPKDTVDFITILENNEIIGRTTLPIYEKWKEHISPFSGTIEKSVLLAILVYLVLSLPYPSSVSCIETFLNLGRLASS